MTYEKVTSIFSLLQPFDRLHKKEVHFMAKGPYTKLRHGLATRATSPMEHLRVGGGRFCDAMRIRSYVGALR